MRIVKVILEDGNSFVTRINGSEEDIKDYYLGIALNMGTIYDDMKRVAEIEFLN